MLTLQFCKQQIQRLIAQVSSALLYFAVLRQLQVTFPFFSRTVWSQQLFMNDGWVWAITAPRNRTFETNKINHASWIDTYILEIRKFMSEG
jgi:hypothetical protein